MKAVAGRPLVLSHTSPVPAFTPSDDNTLFRNVMWWKRSDTHWYMAGVPEKCRPGRPVHLSAPRSPERFYSTLKSCRNT
eukprot:249121-Chlamydomonas_euryale.AAC.14